MAGVEKQTFDFSSHDDKGIEGAIRRHQSSGVTDTPLYRALVEDLARRRSKTLKVDKTIELLIAVAKRREFVTYKEASAASGIKFDKVRWQVGRHLDTILDVCHSRGWPLLTAICVKQNEVASGALSGGSLIGFIAGVRRLGYSVVDPESFLRECQDACFAWAESQP